ncbi:MAG TPA: tetratricopeptide repeat protein [Bryobacteraceae bacterium]|nr:tetratricopeptide repeat protein [Bryobacteraceae bacterium]
MKSLGSGITFLLLTCVAAPAAQQETAFEWNERGIKAQQDGNLPEAEHDYQMALSLWRALGPAYRAHAATTLYNLAQAIIGQGRWRESAPLLEESVDLGRATLGIGDPRTLASLNTLGRVYMVTGEFDRSSAAFLEALRIEREKFANTVELAQTLGSLASLRTRENKLDEALALADEALAAAIRAAGDNAADTAMMYAVVATVHQRAGRPERAIPLYRKARAIYDRTLPPKDPRYSSLLTSEGLVLIDERHFAAAENELRHAMDLLSGCAPGCDLGLAIAENNLGLLRMAQKKYAEADEYFRSALAREEKYSIRPGGDLMQTMKLLAELRQRQHRYEESAALKQRIAAMQSAYR